MLFPLTKLAFFVFSIWKRPLHLSNPAKHQPLKEMGSQFSSKKSIPSLTLYYHCILNLCLFLYFSHNNAIFMQHFSLLPHGLLEGRDFVLFGFHSQDLEECVSYFISTNAGSNKLNSNVYKIF